MNTEQIFPTTLVETFIGDRFSSWVIELREVLLDIERDYPALKSGEARKSNVGGFRSSDHLFKNVHPSIVKVKEAFVKAVENAVRYSHFRSGEEIEVYDEFAWCNINRYGDYNTTHTHPESHWSGIFYVTDIETVKGYPNSGLLELVDPRPAAGVMPVPGFDYGLKQYRIPQAGNLIVFPSWLQHSVHPSMSSMPRISIAMNCKVR